MGLGVVVCRGSGEMDQLCFVGVDDHPDLRKRVDDYFQGRSEGGDVFRGRLRESLEKHVVNVSLRINRDLSWGVDVSRMDVQEYLRCIDHREDWRAGGSLGDPSVEVAGV